jgi:hypothetical protein
VVSEHRATETEVGDAEAAPDGGRWQLATGRRWSGDEGLQMNRGGSARTGVADQAMTQTNVVSFGQAMTGQQTRCGTRTGAFQLGDTQTTLLYRHVCMGTWWPGGERHGKEEADRWDATLDIFWIKNIFEMKIAQ